MKEKKLFSDILFSLSRNVLNVLCQLLLSIAIARGLGVSGNGIYGLSITYITLFASFFSLGINNSIIYYGASGKKSLKDLMNNGIFITALLIITGILTSIVAFLFFRKQVFLNINLTLIVSCIISGILVLLNNFFFSFLQAKQNFKKFNALLIVQSILQLIFQLFIILTVDNKNLALILVLLAYGFSQLLVLCINFLLFSKKGLIVLSVNALQSKTIKNILSYGLKNFFSDILTILNNRIDIYLIGILMTPYEVGIYFLATQITEKIWLLSQSVSTVIFPKMSEEYSTSTNENARLVINKVLWLTFFVTLFFAILLIAVGNYLIILFYGEKYIQAYSVILIMLPGICAMSISRIISNNIAAKGHPEYNLYCSICILILNVILNIVLIQKYAIYGAALATSLVYILNYLIRFFISKFIIFKHVIYS